MNVDIVADFACHTGERPLWHSSEKRLYWTDIPTGRLFRHDPASGDSEPCYDGRPVGGMTLQSDGTLLLFRDRGNIAVFDPRGAGAVTATVVDHIQGHDETRFNDVIADPDGRVFAGTMSFGGVHNGRLYRIERDGSYHVVSDGHGTPNGMGFSPDLETMYFCDSRLARIYAFDYDRATGELSNRRILVETPKDTWSDIGRGDGMTVDTDGNLWSARWDGRHILKYSPRGELLAKIAMPAKKISCVTWGGDGYVDLYATSAGGNERGTDDPHAGALFRLRPGVKGKPDFQSRITL